MAEKISPPIKKIGRANGIKDGSLSTIKGPKNPMRSGWGTGKSDGKIMGK